MLVFSLSYFVDVSMRDDKRFSIFLSPKEKEVRAELQSYQKRCEGTSQAFLQLVKDKISSEEENKKMRKEIEELKQKETYLNDCLSGKSEEELFNKAMGLEFPDDCPDMFPLKGDPTKRRCMCPTPQRPVPLPLDKGKYIVDDPRLCGRCKALGYRKAKDKSKPKHVQHNGGKPCKKPKRENFRGRPSINFPYETLTEY